MSAMTNKADAFFAFVEELSRTGVEWLVLRNYEEIERLEGQDVDLFLRAADVPCAISTLIRAGKRFGGAVVHVYRRHHLIAVYVLFPEEPLPLHVDFYHGAFSWAGIEYVSHDQVLRSSSDYAGLPVPAPEHEAAVLLLASLLDGGFVKKRYLSRVQNLLRSPKARNRFENGLQAVFGEAAFQELRELTFGVVGHSSSEEFALSRRLRRALVFRRMRSSPRLTLISVIKFVFSEVRRFSDPSGPLVVITGPDGSGKSTVVAANRERLSRWLGSAEVFHWRPGLLSDAGVVAGRRDRGGMEVHDDPHGKSSHGVILSAARLGYYLLDYWLGDLILVRRVRARNRIVFFDRYALDMEVDPRRFRFGLPVWMLRGVSSTVPAPNLVIALVAPGEVLVARKAEMSVEMARRLCGSYSTVVSQLKYGHVLDASLPPSVVAERVYQLVLGTMRRNAAARLAKVGVEDGGQL